MASVTFGPQTLSFLASGTWTCPAGVTSVTVQCWGGGGGGCASTTFAGAGGGGGAYAAERALAVTPAHTYTFSVGTGGAGGLLTSAGTFPGGNGATTTFTGDSVTVSALGGPGAVSATAPAGAAAGSSSVAWAGGAGGAGNTGLFSPASGGGGGGGGAGVASAGRAGTGGNPAGAGGPGAAAVAGGGAGGAGGLYNGAFSANGTGGGSPGGGGGGCCGTGKGQGSSGGDGSAGQILVTYVLPPSWTCPAGVFAVLAECWGGGAGGAWSSSGGGAGGGGEWAATPLLAVTPGTVYPVTVGAGGLGATSSGAGAGGQSTVFAGDSVTVTAHGGSGGSGTSGGAGGTGSSATSHHNGGAGGAGAGGGGGGGGGSGCPGAAGTAGTAATTTHGGAGAVAVSTGGPGGDGGTAPAGGLSPLTGPGGGGGGGKSSPGGNGFAGRVTLTWAIASFSGNATLTASQYGPPEVLNQWAGVTTQNPVFGPSLPANASTVVPLAPSSSVGGGTGTATAGNWLFAVVGWHAAPGSPPVTVSVGDDLHSYWRPQAPSDPTGACRTTVWFTPNLIGVPQAVYVAPSGYAAGFSVLVTEVGGLGTWDETVAVTAYSAAAESLALFAPAGVTGLEYSAGVPSPVLHPITDTGGTAVPQLTFFLAAVTGDSVSAGTTFAPPGYTQLETVTCTNGHDFTSDTVLASACAVASSGQTVTATSTSPEDLSGVIIAVVIGAPSPVPYGLNPSWPYLIFEAAFGAGFQTPADQMEWTDLQTRAHRLRSWDETTGVQYELDALQASEVTLALDNPEGAVSPFNPASPYYPHITPGTPVRIRAVPPGGTRWHVIQRNMERWPQTWEKTYRGISNASATDLWSVANRLLPTSYRAEVLADLATGSGWWWPCDDSGVNQATDLVNAAPASGNPLQIVISPAGLTSYGPFSPGGNPQSVFAYIATQAFAQEQGWMYGDPDSAAWQQAGNGVSSAGRYLSCQDATFPPLSGGVTIEGWFKPALATAGIPIRPATASGGNEPEGYLGQPAATSGPLVSPGPIVLWTIASADAPLAQLSMDAKSQLTFTTWAGTTPTSTVIYTLYPQQYLWDNAWMGVTVTMTQSSWVVYVNGGVVATVSGPAAMAAQWQWFLAGAGTGNMGAPPAAGTLAGCGNVSYSHLAIYPRVLPGARIMAHFMAAYAAFGQLPAPAVTCQFLSNSTGGPYWLPDGMLYLGIPFFNDTGSGGSPLGDRSVLSVYVTNSAGDYTSAVSQPESVNLFTDPVSGEAWLAVTGLAPEYSYWTGNAGGAEQLHARTVQPYLYVTSYGTGASPPAAASALGDTVAQRIERLLLSGGITSPQRCIDPASLAVVAELDTGGQSSGDSIGNITASDDGFLHTDTCGNLCYFSREHLAAQQVAWHLGPFVTYGQIPYSGDVSFDTDPQRVFNDIAVTQFDVFAVPAGQAGSATGSAETHGGLVFGPGAQYAAAVQASLAQFGDNQQQFTSYLQDTTQIQAQASWIFGQFGVPRQRITSLTVDAAGMAQTVPQAWEYVLAVNPGDVIQVTQQMPGQPPFTSVWRVTQVKRKINFAQGTASAEVVADWYPPSMWGVPSLEEIEDEAGNDVTDQTGLVME